jgi:signal transduction protein with GAF and PtsI domain
LSEATGGDSTVSSPIWDSFDRCGQTAAVIRSRPLSVSDLNDRQWQLFEEARSVIQQAITVREEVAAMRHRLWIERLTQRRAGTGRDAALDSALDAARSVAAADCANIQLMHPDGRGLVLKAQRGFEPPFLDFFAYVDDSHSACGVALRERRPIVVEDVIRSPIFARTRGLEVMLEAGIDAVVSTPLIGDTGELLGMLSVHYRRPRAHLDSDRTRLQALAPAIAEVISAY